MKSSKPDSILGKQGPQIRTRSFVLFSAISLIAVILIGRLFYLQIVNYKKYRAAVIEQMIYETPISASRGVITDRNGVVLATNYTTERIFISPYDIESEDERVLICKGLSEILGVDYDYVYEQSTKTKYKDRTIKKNVDEATADIVRQYIADNELERKICLAEMTTRVYPFSTLASHVIGFCGTDGGSYGLEYYYNSVLSGVSGKIVAAQSGNMGSMPYNYETYIDASSGANLVTTIDYKIQSILENYLEQAAVESGCKSRAQAIAMDPSTGEILGMAVYPSYDLNNPTTFPEYYQKKAESAKTAYGEGTVEYQKALSAFLLEMWNNKTITETYEPGSTSKIFTTSMALEENKAKTSDTFYCSGSYTVAGWKIKCHKTTGHGLVTFSQGLMQSCNPCMMMLAERIGIPTFCKYFSAFGLDCKTGIDLPGETGSVYRSEDNMSVLDLAVYSFGQRYNVTAIQQISAVAAVANGGTLVTPHVVKAVKDNDGNIKATFGTTEKRQVISRETASTISAILAEGVATNGGAKNAYVAGYSVAAKTGTSEKGTVGNKRIASTVAYAPSYDPKIVILLAVDEPTIGSIYGSTVAAPYVAKMLAEILPYLGVEPVYTAEEMAKLEVSVKNYRGLSLDTAIKNISDAGLKYEIIGAGKSVITQVPVSGSKMSPENGKIILYTSDEVGSAYATVPSVVGKSAAEANKILADAGFNIHLTGVTSGSSAVAVEQSIAAGISAEKGSIITVDFRITDVSD